ncbi:MAG: hypothetical protein AAGJ79_15365 [Verrucomicrobiota bacterium]
MGTKFGIFRSVVVVSVGMLSFAWAVSANAAEAFHEFVNKAGQKLEAKLIGADATRAQIQRKDGKKFILPIDSLSDLDQSFIKKWVKKNPKLGIKEDIKYRFEVSAEKKRLDRQQRRSGSGTETIETWIYEIEIRNGAAVDLNDLTVEYVAFVRDEDGETRRSHAPLKRTVGKYTFEKLEQGALQTINTTEFQLIGFELDAGYYFPGKKKDKFEDSHGGLWLKIFHQGEEVKELKYADSAFKDLSWENAKK